MVDQILEMIGRDDGQIVVDWFFTHQTNKTGGVRFEHVRFWWQTYYSDRF